MYDYVLAAPRPAVSPEFSEMKSSPYVNPGCMLQLLSYQVKSKSVQAFWRDWASNIQTKNFDIYNISKI